MGLTLHWPQESERASAGGGDDVQLVGRVIGEKFRLRERIASGASGSVYCADQIALGRTVAVKLLRPELALDDRFLSRFHGEALAASRLNHPNTVAVIDYGQTDDGVLYLAMEYLRGLSLAEVARAERPLSVEHVVDFVAQIAAGAAEAHDAGVVHADLKPENVVVERRQRGWNLVKVVDFGIARLLGAASEETSDGAICGTPEYMAPEIVRGGEPTFASDIYALGAILFELLAGAPPFEGESTIEILTAHLQHEPPPLSAVAERPEIPPALEEIARLALAKEPQDRFASAEAFRDALLAAARGPSERAALCADCGAPNAERFKYCPECGRPREDALALFAEREATARADRAEIDTPPPESSPLFPLPLVGRDTALTRARAHARARGGCLVVAGPPGSGKTRLLREAFAGPRPGGDTPSLIIATPDPSGAGAPYYPVRAVVATALALPPRCTYADLERAALELGLVSRDLPGITELLAPRGDLDELEPAARRRELFASARRALVTAAARKPLVFAFDDADRYDEPSRAFLRDLAGRAHAEDLRVAIAISAPAAADAAGADDLTTGTDAQRVWLAPLGAPALRGLASHLEHGGRAELPPADDLGASGGHPGHINERYRLFVEGGGPSPVADSTADLLAARLELLPREAQLVAQAIAAYGIEADEEGARAALGGSLDGAEVAEAIAILEARGIIARGDRLAFERAFVREVVYAVTPAETKRTLHAACLEHLGPDLEPGARAIHLEGAGRRAEAARAFETAGDAARVALDRGGSAGHYQRGLENARRAMLAAEDDLHRRRFISISIKLASALAEGGDLGLARGVLDEALGHCHEAPVLKARLFREIGRAHAEAHELTAAEDSARQAAGLGIMAGERELLTEIYLDLADYRVRAGKWAEAAADLEEALDLLHGGESGGAGRPPASLWRLALRLAKLRAERGERARALAAAREAENMATAVGARLGVARAHAVIAAQLEGGGDASGAAHYRRSAAERMRVLGDRRGTVDILLSGERLTRERPQPDAEALSSARELADEIGWREGAERARRALAR